MSFGYQVLGFGSGGSSDPAFTVSVIAGGGHAGKPQGPAGRSENYGGSGGGGGGGYRVLDTSLIQIGTTYNIVIGISADPGVGLGSSFIGGGHSLVCSGGGAGANSGGSAGGPGGQDGNGGGNGGAGAWNGDYRFPNYNGRVTGTPRGAYGAMLGYGSGGGYRNGGGGGGGMATGGADAKNYNSSPGGGAGSGGAINTDNAGGAGGAGITDTVSGICLLYTSPSPRD